MILLSCKDKTDDDKGMAGGNFYRKNFCIFTEKRYFLMKFRFRQTMKYFMLFLLINCSKKENQHSIKPQHISQVNIAFLVDNSLTMLAPDLIQQDHNHAGSHQKPD